MSLDLAELRGRSIANLVDTADYLGVESAADLRKQELIFEIVRRRAGSTGAHATGILEKLPDGFGFLRSPDASYMAGPDDIYVSPSQIRRFNLRTGDVVTGLVRAPKESERYFALIRVQQINDCAPDSEEKNLLFENLTAVYPTEHIDLGSSSDTLRMIDLLAPMGFGQRIALFTSLHSGRRQVISDLLQELHKSYPNAFLMVVLIGERPEEVTHMQRNAPAEVLSSTFDETALRHVQVAEMARERAKRLVEQGKNVVFVLDSLTHLTRAYDTVDAPGGRVKKDTFDTQSIVNALQYCGAGRNLEEGGSLTILSTVITGGDSAIDNSLVQAIRGTTNSEIQLSKTVPEACPPIVPSRTATEKSDYLDTSVHERMLKIRSTLTGDDRVDQQRLLDLIRDTSSNNEVLDSVRALDKKRSVGK